LKYLFLKQRGGRLITSNCFNTPFWVEPGRLEAGHLNTKGELEDIGDMVIGPEEKGYVVIK